MLKTLGKHALALLIAGAPSAFASNTIYLDTPYYRGLAATAGGDWKPAIDQAILNLPASGGTILFPAGEHMYQSAWIEIKNKSNFIIDGNGSTIEYIAHSPVTGGYGSFSFENSRNFVFKNLVIDGNRDQRDPDEVYAHSVIVLGGSDYTLENIKVIDAVVDSFYIAAPTPGNPATYPTNGTLSNCSSDNAYRQGMSIINAFNLNIIGGHFSGTHGTAPEAGVDIEADPVSGVVGSRNVRFQSVTFENNAGQGLLISGVGGPKDISVRDSYFRGDKKGALYIASGDITVSGNSFVDFPQATGGIVTVDSASTATRVSITDNHFRNITAAYPAIALKGQDTIGDVVISGNTFDDVYSVLSTYKKHVIFSGNSVSSINSSVAALSLQSSDSLVLGNSFRGTQRYAIWVSGANNRIIDNTITGHVFPDSQPWGVIRITDDTKRNEVRNNLIRDGDSIHNAIRIDNIDSNNGVAGTYVDNRCPGYLEALPTKPCGDY